jgi:hypothetical protein
MTAAKMTPDERAREHERVFAVIEHAAVAGLRCPGADEIKAPHGVVPILARSGRIRIEVYAGNWRVITITSGEHAGKQTAPPPFQHSGPYIMIDRNGRHEKGRVVPREPISRKRAQPSTPRLREEWTEERWQTALEMRAQGCELAEIGAAIGMHYTTVGKRMQREHVAMPRVQGRAFRLGSPHAGRVPDEVAEERIRRTSAPYRGLTGYLLGDPPVGCSALDRKR